MAKAERGKARGQIRGQGRGRSYDVVQVFGRVPDILGMELVMNKKIWEGRYYIDGRRHPYRRDKLKIKIFNANGRGNDIWVFEQGGESMPIASWLVRYGGAIDYKSAYSILEGHEGEVSAEFTRRYVGECQRYGKDMYVPIDEYLQYRELDKWDCPLYRYMVGLFGQERVSAVWDMYGATTDERGLAVWWYIDAEGRVCYDKRMRYGENGRRDKTFGGTRRYRVGDGFTSRPLYGANTIERNKPVGAIFVASDGLKPSEWEKLLPNTFDALKTQKINVVESEKTAMFATLAFGGVWLATGGKSNLRDIDIEMLLWPDVDAANEWSERGNVCEWWHDAENLGAEIGENWDLGDFIVYLCGLRAGMAASGKDGNGGSGKDGNGGFWQGRGIGQ